MYYANEGSDDVIDLSTQPRSQGLSSLPPLVVGRNDEAEKRVPGNEVAFH